jgi:CheY-like chemotaxis protein
LKQLSDEPGNAASEQLPPRRKIAVLADGFVKDLFTTGVVLQRLDYDVYIVSSAEDALKLIEAALPALIITELAMPNMSGLELLVRIKHDPRTKMVPVIIHAPGRFIQRHPGVH